MNNVCGPLYYHGNAKDSLDPRQTSYDSYRLDTTQIRHTIIERGLTHRLGDLAIPDVAPRNKKESKVPGLAFLLDHVQRDETRQHQELKVAEDDVALAQMNGSRYKRSRSQASPSWTATSPMLGRTTVKPLRLLENCHRSMRRKSAGAMPSPWLPPVRGSSAGAISLHEEWAQPARAPSAQQPQTSSSKKPQEASTTKLQAASLLSKTSPSPVARPASANSRLHASPQRSRTPTTTTKPSASSTASPLAQSRPKRPLSARCEALRQATPLWMPRQRPGPEAASARKKGVVGRTPMKMLAASVTPAVRQNTSKETSAEAASVRPDTAKEKCSSNAVADFSPPKDTNAALIAADTHSGASQEAVSEDSQQGTHVETKFPSRSLRNLESIVLPGKEEDELKPAPSPILTSPIQRKFAHFKNAAKMVATAKRSVPLAERGLRQAKKVVEAAPFVDASTNERAPWARQLRPSSAAALGSSANASAEETTTAAEATSNLEAVLAAHPLAAAHWWGYMFEEKLLITPASPMTSTNVEAQLQSPSRIGEVFEIGVEAAMEAAKKILPPFPTFALWVHSEGLSEEHGDERLHEAAADAHAQDPFTCISLSEARCFRDAVSVLIFLKNGGKLHDLPSVDQRFLLTKPLRYVTSWSSKLLHQPLPTLLGAFVVQAEAFRRPPRALFVLQAFKSFAVPSIAVVVPLSAFEELCANPSGMDADVRSVAVADPSIPWGLMLPVDKAMACGLGLVLPHALRATADKYANEVQRRQRAREGGQKPAKDRVIAEAAARELELKQMRLEDAQSLAAAQVAKQRLEEEAAARTAEAARIEAAEKAFSPDKYYTKKSENRRGDGDSLWWRIRAANKRAAAAEDK